MAERGPDDGGRLARKFNSGSGRPFLMYAPWAMAARRTSKTTEPKANQLESIADGYVTHDRALSLLQRLYEALDALAPHVGRAAEATEEAQRLYREALKQHGNQGGPESWIAHELSTLAGNQHQALLLLSSRVGGCYARLALQCLKSRLQGQELGLNFRPLEWLNANWNADLHAVDVPELTVGRKKLDRELDQTRMNLRAALLAREYAAELSAYSDLTDDDRARLRDAEHEARYLVVPLYHYGVACENAMEYVAHRQDAKRKALALPA
jgi:hypothetical protein